ncbi:ABC transporter permease [Allosalinactinospora lopnorensis]|uniref:ABC transporter permease n=1 Tax=Allosalinactinospora lopnorensis TaxID=1352348 RepID=UPI000623D78C|nr:ABC transporter permease [Allosalinactinospora lopnorensis]
MGQDRFVKLLPWFSTPVVIVLLVVAWELFIRAFGVSEFVLPSPGTVLVSLVALVQDPETWHHAAITATEAITGFLAAVVLGVATGVALGKSALLERALRPMIIAAQVVPKVALIPLFVIWFGFGLTSKIIMAAMLAFFPIMLNVLLGVRSVDPGQRDVMRSLTASRWNTFRHLEFKSTLPYVFTGMEVGIVFAIIGTIVGEYLGGSEGLGYLVVVSLNQLDGPQLFAVIVLLASLGLLLYFAINGLKRLVIPWHESVYSQNGVT